MHSGTFGHVLLLGTLAIPVTGQLRIRVISGSNKGSGDTVA